MKWVLFACVTAAAVLLCFLLTVLCNYRHNRRADAQHPTEKRLLNDQNGQTGDAFRFGWFHARYNICEVLALHNALLLLEQPSSLPSLIRLVQLRGAMLLFGTFGSSPFAIARLVRQYGCTAKRVRLTEMTQSGIYILSYWNSKRLTDGVHTVALQYDGSKYTAYNLCGAPSNRLPEQYASV